MKFAKRTLLTVLSLFVMVVAPMGQASAEPLDMGEVAEAAGKVWDVETNEFVAAWTCPSGYVCFYSGAAGTGRACQWWGADDDWLAGSVTCSWARSDSVESVYNNGTSTAFNGVRYYTQTDYRTSVGCIPRGAHGTLQTSRLLRSHKWESGSCG